MANRYFRWMIIRSWEKSKNALGALQSPHHVLSPTCRKAGPGHKSAGDPLKNHRKPAFKESPGRVKHGRILLTWRSFVDNLLSGVLLFLKINLITVQRKTIPWLHEITVMGSNFQFLIQIWTHIKIYIYYCSSCSTLFQKSQDNLQESTELHRCCSFSGDFEKYTVIGPTQDSDEKYTQMKNEFENVGNRSCTRNETKSQSKSCCTACVRAGGPRETQQKLVMVECCCKNMCRKACGKRSEPGPWAKCQGSFAILPMKNIPNIMETLSQLDGSLSICTYVRRKNDN